MSRIKPSFFPPHSHPPARVARATPKEDARPFNLLSGLWPPPNIQRLHTKFWEAVFLKEEENHRNAQIKENHQKPFHPVYSGIPDDFIYKKN